MRKNDGENPRWERDVTQMAKAKGWASFVYRKDVRPKRTSIGKSRNSRPKGKHKNSRHGWKRYRGQGKQQGKT